MIILKFWETLLPWHAKCSVPVNVCLSKTLHALISSLNIYAKSFYATIYCIGKISVCKHCFFYSNVPTTGKKTHCFDSQWGSAGAHHREPPSRLYPWVNLCPYLLFLEYFVRRTRLLVRDCLWRNTITLFLLDGIMHSWEFERLKIERYGQRLSPRVYMGDGESGWWAPGPSGWHTNNNSDLSKTTTTAIRTPQICIFSRQKQ